MYKVYQIIVSVPISNEKNADLGVMERAYIFSTDDSRTTFMNKLPLGSYYRGKEEIQILHNAAEAISLLENDRKELQDAKNS